MPDYKWNPIEDLPQDWEEFSGDELSSLADIWREQRERLHGSEALKRFNTQLQRRWAIETGIIEGLYTIDRGITQLLIERGIDASLIPHGKTDKPVGTILPIIKDQETVIRGLFDYVGQSRALSTSYIKELHQALTAHQQTVEAYDHLGNCQEVALLRGDWKRLPNNPSRSNGSTHEYCPPEHVASEMDRLIELHAAHCAANVAPEVEAAWLHHRFTQIHPFQDGNGRVARALASLVFLRLGWFPLVVVSDEHRDEYIQALEQADRGDIAGLVNLFARLQREAFVGALSISEDVISGQESLRAVIGSAADRLRGRAEERRAEKTRVFDTAKTLQNITKANFQSVGEEIRSQLAGIEDSYQITADRSSEETNNWFWNQVVDTAKALSYFANLRSYHAWVRLKIQRAGERQTEVIVSFHSLGTEFLGVMAASAFVEHRVPGEDEIATGDGPYPACREVFQFSYNQEPQAVTARFEKWLSSAIIAGLDQWRRQL